MSNALMVNEDRINRYVVQAIGAHLCIIVILATLKFVLGWDIFNQAERQKNLEVVQSSVRVDVVGLPKFTLQELKAMNLGATSPVNEEPEQNKIEQSNETSEVEFKKKSSKVNLSNLLKNLSKKKVVKKTGKKKKKKTTKVDARELNKLILEGNKVSQGSSFTGEQLDVSQQVFIRYIQELPDKVRPNWKLPSYLLDKELKCRIQLFIGSNGKILKMSLFESSGDKEYDNKALEAVKLSSPLPKPPTAILSKVAGGGVLLGFPL